MTISALILAGGAGTRLWPLSTDATPKQFLQLFGGSSLLEMTFARLSRLTPPENIFVSTNARYFEQVVQLLPSLPQANVLLEPARRNNAPAIAICCFEIERRVGETTVAIFPSDHFVEREDAFLELVREGAAFASATDYLTTIALRPTHPETGYGYLELGEALQENVVEVRRFVEKPDSATAAAFLAAGNFAWNGGMFLWNTTSFRKALIAVAPEIATRAARYLQLEDAEARAKEYEAMPSISIDYALMEKAPKVASLPGDFGWSDVGSWAAVRQLAESSGNLFAANAERPFVYAPGRNVAVVGFDDAAVIESERGILVVNLKKSDGLSDLVKKIES